MANTLNRVARYLNPILVIAAAIWVVTCGSSSTSPTPTPTPTPTTPVTVQLAQVSVDASVIGGNQAQGTVTLSGNAPAGGTVVQLSSDNAAAVVPSTVTVSAGSSSAQFTINTTTVASTITAKITATLNGTSRDGSVQVTPVPAQPLVARFSVTSASKGADACALQADATIDCDFDGSASTGPIKSYTWNYVVGNKNPPAETSSSPKYRPNPGCGFFGGLTQNGTLTFVMMQVVLRVSDAAGNMSDKATNNNVKLFPQKNCGNGF